MSGVLSKKIAIAEIFSSLQGEGPRLGEKHLFIRFPACNLHCGFCDEMDHEPKEILVEELLREVLSLDQKLGPHRFISLTGGEPLLYHAVIKEIVPILREQGFKFYLETAGVHVEELREVLPLVDVVSMDIKLPSVTKDCNYFKEHREFLKLSQSKDVYVKIVISKEVSWSEFQQAVDLIHDINPKTLLVLQPMSTGDEKDIDGELLRVLNELQSMALEKLENVRIMPRLHKILGVK